MSKIDKLEKQADNTQLLLQAVIQLDKKITNIDNTISINTNKTIF